MAGYIGSKAAVTQVDGYTKSEADNRYVEGDDTLYVDQTNNRVGIGTSSPTSAIHAVGGAGTNIAIQSTAGNHWRLGDAVGSSNGTFVLYDYTNSAARLSVTNSGNFLVGTVNTFDAGDSSNGSDDRFGFISGRLNVEKNNAAAVSFKRSGGNGTLVNLARGGVGSIGNISVSTTSASFNTTSDYRLKENVADLTGATDRLKQLQPKRFNFIVDPDAKVDGFLAHEVSSVVPEAITGEHNEVDADGDPVYQGIDQAKLVPLLTAALQEAITEIETLKTKVAALEAGE